MQTYVCTRIHTCTLTHIHTCIYTPTCTITLTHVSAHLYMPSGIYTLTSVDICSHMYTQPVHTHAHTCVHTRTRAAVGRAAQHFRSPFTEAVDTVLTSPCWCSGLWRRFLRNL